MGKETSRSLLQGLIDRVSCLDNLVHDLSELAIVHKFQIRCFYETRTTQPVNALSKRIGKSSPFLDIEVRFAIVFVLFYLLISL